MEDKKSSVNLYSDSNKDEKVHLDGKTLEVKNNIGGYKNIVALLGGISSTCGDVICDDAGHL